MDKNVTACDLPEIVVCYKENSYHVAKDICVDEGVPVQEKFLFREKDSVTCSSNSEDLMKAEKVNVDDPLETKPSEDSNGKVEDSTLCNDPRKTNRDVEESSREDSADAQGTSNCNQEDLMIVTEKVKGSHPSEIESDENSKDEEVATSENVLKECFTLGDTLSREDEQKSLHNNSDKPEEQSPLLQLQDEEKRSLETIGLKTELEKTEHPVKTESSVSTTTSQEANKTCNDLEIKNKQQNNLLEGDKHFGSSFGETSFSAAVAQGLKEEGDEGKSTDAGTSQSQVHDPKVETLDYVSMAQGLKEEGDVEKSTDAGRSQSQVDDSKVETLDCVLMAQGFKEEGDEVKSTDDGTSQSQGDSKVETLDCISMATGLKEEGDPDAGTSQSQVNDFNQGDSKVETLDSVSMEKGLKEVGEEGKSTDAGTSQSQVDDPKVETLDCVSMAQRLKEEGDEGKSTDVGTSQSQVDGSKVETLDCVSMAQGLKEEGDEGKSIDVGTSQSQVDDSKVETLDCVSMAQGLKEEGDEGKATDAGTSQSQVDDPKVETLDCVSMAQGLKEEGGEGKSIDVGTSQSQVDDPKVETLDCVSMAQGLKEDDDEGKSIDVGTSQSQVDDSKVETLDCVSVAKGLKEEGDEGKSTDAGTSQSQVDDPRVETLDSVSMAQGLKEEGDEGKSTDAGTSQSQVHDPKVETLDYVSMAQRLKEEGNKLFQKRYYQGAMLKYEKATKILPKDHVEVSNIRAYIASCYMQLDPIDYEKAILECDLALEITPDHNKALLKRSRCYEALNKLDLALKDVLMVSKLDPNNPMASEISEKLKRTLESKGLRVKDSVIELSPDYVEPVGVSPTLWAQAKLRMKKKNRSNQLQEKSDGENAETEKKKNNNYAAEKGKEKVIDKQSKKKTKGKLLDQDVEKTVKFVYSEDIRLSKLPLNCTLFQLREIVQERFPSLRAVHIKYKDQEGDLVTITTEEEIRMSEVSARSLPTMRLYVVEVSPEQDPFFGRLVEMKKLKITADSFKTKFNGKGTCKTEDWMIEFARLFKIEAKVDSETCLNLQELGMKLNSEAMEEVVTSDEAQGPFDRAAQQFQEVAARSLLKLGNVHMLGARKKLNLLRGVSGETVSEQVKTAYECAQKKHTKAKEKYEEAMKIKPDLFEIFLALGLLQFEEARLSWYYVLVSHLDLKTWSYADVVQFYESAESNITKSIEGLKNLDSKVPGNSTQDNLAGEAAKLKSWLDLLLCAVLYERSLMEYKLDLPIWGESLEAAIEKFELAGTCKEDVAAVIREHYVTDSTLRDLRFHMEEIIEIYDEICEAKQWKFEIPSDQLEEILKRRTEKIFHLSNIGIQSG